MPRNLRWILLLAVIVRSFIAGAAYLWRLNPQIFYAKDTWSYLQPALEWITTRSYTTHGEPEIFRTPGYAVLLGIGIHLGQIEFVTITLQILLSCLTTYLVYSIARELFSDERIAQASALLYSLEPLSIIFCSWLLSETLYVALLALALLALLRFARHHDWKHLWLTALTFAATAYVRPIDYYLPLLITIVLAAYAIFMRDGRFLRRTICLCLLVYACLGLWQFRNIRQTGYPGFSVAMTYNLYFHQIAALEARHQQRSFYEILDEMGFYEREKYLQAHPEQRSWSLAERYEFMQREGLLAIRRAPLDSLIIYMQGLGIALFDPGASEYLRLFQLYPRSGRLLETMVGKGLLGVAHKVIAEQSLLFFLSAFFGLWLVLMYTLALLGWRHFPLSLSITLLLTIALYHLVLSGGTLAAGRLRLPMMLVVCVFAGAGWLQALASLSGKLLTAEASKTPATPFIFHKP